MNDLKAFLTHPASKAGLGTAIGYGLILALLLVVVFLVPYVLFRVF